MKVPKTRCQCATQQASEVVIARGFYNTHVKQLTLSRIQTSRRGGAHENELALSAQGSKHPKTGDHRTVATTRHTGHCGRASPIAHENRKSRSKAAGRRR